MRTGPKYSRKRDKALKQLIGRSGSLSELARVIGKSRQYVSKWRTVPDKHYKALLEAFPE